MAWWATIRASAGIEDGGAADAHQQRVEADIRAMVGSLPRVHNEVVDVRIANGDLQLWLAGNHNHRYDAAIEFFTAVTRAAPGSYGILYAMDHNFITQPWERWVMRRGQVTRELESALTPHLGRVEDVEL